MNLPQSRAAAVSVVALMSVASMVVSVATVKAQTYPTRTITLIVPAPPGGTTDLAARILSTPLAKALGQTIVVDNRPGASGIIAAEYVARAQPDGYTLLMQYSGYQTITPLLTKGLNWDPIRDFAPVANVLSAPQVVVVRPSLPVRTLAELVAYAKANPGKLTYASPGAGSLQHLTGELLKQTTGIEMIHVPYKGMAPAIADLLGGTVDLTFGTPPPMLGLIQGGKLRALAVTGRSRLASFPDVPTAAEAGFKVLDASAWFAIFAPRATPQPIIDKLTAEIAKVMHTEEFKRKAAEQGAEADYKSPQELAAMTQAELTRWAQVIKAGNIHE